MLLAARFLYLSFRSPVAPLLVVLRNAWPNAVYFLACGLNIFHDVRRCLRRGINLFRKNIDDQNQIFAGCAFWLAHIFEKFQAKGADCFSGVIGKLVSLTDVQLYDALYLVSFFVLRCKKELRSQAYVNALYLQCSVRRVV